MDDLGGLTDLGKGWNLFSGMEGIPFRTKNSTAPLIKKDDPDHLQPQLANDVKVRIFDLSNTDDLKDYEEVLNFCARKKGRVLEKEVEYVKESQSWKILLSWSAYFWEDPAESSKHCKKYYNSGD